MPDNNLPYPAIAIANYFLKLGKERGIAINPMKLNKLVYLAHGWHLALYDLSLIDEMVEAWTFEHKSVRDAKK